MVTEMRCFEPPRRKAEPMQAMLRHSLTETERRSCAARKGWRTRRQAKEMNDATVRR